jgi:hypothetical protein
MPEPGNHLAAGPQREVPGRFGTVGFPTVDPKGPRRMDGPGLAGHRDALSIDLDDVIITGQVRPRPSLGGRGFMA